jgi:glucose/arabinose dehydrogenase
MRIAAGFVVAVPIAVALLSPPLAPAAAEITNAPAQKTKAAIKADTFAKGLVHPWGMAFLPDGRLLITERPGRMRVIGKDGRLSAPLKGVPPVLASGQGGLLDVALAPDFAASRLVYLSYSEPREGGNNGASVGSAKLVLEADGGRLDDVKVIFRQEPASTGGMHFGSRLAFARDGNLFVTLGERSHSRERAQDLATHFGKVVRIRPDGSAPPDNPFVGKAGVLPEIWSWGHRNPQSAAIHPATGKLWTVEHGARGGDEVNVPLAGRNYGWPVITYGRDYSYARIGEGTAKRGMEQPIYYWDPSIAPSGMAFYTGDLTPAWKGNLFVGALAGQHLARLVLDGEEAVAEERLLTDLGERIRDVRQGPDGALYVLTDSANGRVLRIRPR